MSTISKINKLSKSEFVKVFANIFENARWIADKLYSNKPFKNFQDLSLKIIVIFESSSREKQLKILQAHPDLADKTKIGLLTIESNKEQKSAKLDQCSEKEFKEFESLNDAYKKKFGFPYICAVRGIEKKEILSNFRQRILYDVDMEFTEAKKQVKKIAIIRIDEIIKK